MFEPARISLPGPPITGTAGQPDRFMGPNDITPCRLAKASRERNNTPPRISSSREYSTTSLFVTTLRPGVASKRSLTLSGHGPGALQSPTGTAAPMSSIRATGTVWGFFGQLVDRT